MAAIVGGAAPDSAAPPEVSLGGKDKEDVA
jgi:hypothetical protein